MEPFAQPSHRVRPTATIVCNILCTLPICNGSYINDDIYKNVAMSTGKLVGVVGRSSAGPAKGPAAQPHSGVITAVTDQRHPGVQLAAAITHEPLLRCVGGQSTTANGFGPQQTGGDAGSV